MADPLLTTFLAFFHVFFAMLWLGGSFIFAAVLGRTIQSLPPPAMREFVVRTGAVNRYFQVVAGLTVLFGFLLLYVFINGDFGVLTTTAWGQRISIGMAFGLAAFLLTILSTGPKLDQAAATLRRADVESEGLPEEYVRLNRSGIMSAGISLVLVLITLVFMVSAGFY